MSLNNENVGGWKGSKIDRRSSAVFLKFNSWLAVIDIINRLYLVVWNTEKKKWNFFYPNPRPRRVFVRFTLAKAKSASSAGEITIKKNSPELKVSLHIDFLIEVESVFE